MPSAATRYRPVQGPFVRITGLTAIQSRFRVRSSSSMARCSRYTPGKKARARIRPRLPTIDATGSAGSAQATGLAREDGDRMTVGDRALGQQAPRLAGGSKDDDLQDSTHGLDGSSRSLGGTVDADEGGPHARPGQVPDQEQVDQEGDRVFVTARDDGDHVRSQGHNREEDRDLPGPRLESPEPPGHDEAEDAEEDQDRPQGEGTGLPLDVRGRREARGDQEDETTHEESERSQDLQDGQDGD